MWEVNDYTLVNYLLHGDVTKWGNKIIHVENVIDDGGEYIQVIGKDSEWEEEIEVLIPDCETVPLLIWE